jgi:hypothetical protein
VAAPRIKAAFPIPFAAPTPLVNLLKREFPESFKTLTQVAWALASAGYPASASTTAMTALYKDTSTGVADITAAIKAAYPAPSVRQQVTQLKADSTMTAQTAALPIRTAHGDLTALQTGVLLMMNFSSTAQNPTQMVIALKSATYNPKEVSPVLRELFPLSSSADIAAALKSIT